jgi:hypothetical protein
MIGACAFFPSVWIEAFAPPLKPPRDKGGEAQRDAVEKREYGFFVKKKQGETL